MENEIIKERLKSTRKKYKYTQQNVADILGMQRATYAKYENGQAIPPINVFRRLATMYGVPVDYLIGRDAYVKGIMADSNDSVDNKIKFFNYFLSMSDDQRNLALGYMDDILNVNDGDENPPSET